MANKGLAQHGPADTTATRTVTGGAYQKSKFYQWLWGRNRRGEWTTPIRVPVLWLDTAYGGLIPYKTGGGNESKTLRLKTISGKEYTLRSINKSRKDVVLPVFKHTFIEDIIDDGVSMSYPYGALAVPVMEEYAGIYHTNPRLVYLPEQPALDTFNKKFSDDLYLFEQRLAGDWSDADNLGNFNTFNSTDEVIDSLLKKNYSKANQFAFAKARLFDMLIADWDRHEDNWQWGLKNDGNQSVYEAVPRDRDQAFYTHNGVLIDRILPASGLGFMQNFGNEVDDISMLNFEERNLDRFFTNELRLHDWLTAASELQQALTDSIIEASVKQLPPEIFSISGNELISKLKSRRAQLSRFTNAYYLFIAEEVEITGSDEPEYFEVKKINDGDVSVKVFRLHAKNKKDEAAFYSRIFKPAETKELRLYGIGGKDIYSIDGDMNTIRLRIIGGRDNDSIMIKGKGRIHVYDDHHNFFETASAKLHLSRDSAAHAFNYSGYNYNKKGFEPSVFYNNDDRLYVGLGYGFTKYRWRHEPFATKQLIDLHYSISQKAISTTYTALFPKLIGSWDLSLFATYDAERWTNFFGLGNETTLITTDKDYFRIRSEESLASATVHKNFKKNTLAASAFFQHVQIRNDSDRYIAKIFAPIDTGVFETNNYIGANFRYTFLSLNDSVVPTRGISFLGNASYVCDVSEHEFFQKYFFKLQAYIPLSGKFSFAVKAGAATVAGNNDVLNSAQFHEHAVIGGPLDLRGFRRERFWGKSSFYNNNELRFITDLRTHLLNAKTGLLIFFDEGKVWMPHEASNLLHTGYGAGIMLAPFNKLCTTVTYGISKESKLFQVTLNKLF